MNKTVEYQAEQVGIMIAELAQEDHERLYNEDFMHVPPNRAYEIFDAFEESQVFEEIVKEANGIRDGTAITNDTFDQYDRSLNYALFKWLAFGIYSNLEKDPDTVVLSPIASTRYFCRRTPSSKRVRHMFEEERPSVPFSTQGLKVIKGKKPDEWRARRAVEYMLSGDNAVRRKLRLFEDHQYLEASLRGLGITLVRPKVESHLEEGFNIRYLPLGRNEMLAEIERMRLQHRM